MFNAQIEFKDKKFEASFSSNGAFNADFSRRTVTEIKDYERLDNLPMIEGVTLIGNKTFPQLNMASLTNQEIEDLLT